MRIAVVGDFQPDSETHLATTAACEHAATSLGQEAQVTWVGTRELAAGAGCPLVDAHGVYFVSLDNVLWALNRSNGNQRWKRPLALRPTNGPLRAGQTLIVSGFAAKLPAYKIDDGTDRHPLVLELYSYDAGAIVFATREGTLDPRAIDRVFLDAQRITAAVF